MTEPSMPTQDTLRSVLEAALVDFPEPECAEIIRRYVSELAHLMGCEDPNHDHDHDEDGSTSQRVDATCRATEEDALSLVCRFEEYLESVLMGRVSRPRNAT